ncbi:MAG: PAS domain-containing sensor histidine kinase [Thiothrix lacustris]|uniref:histidine kinase n=1 Tax=Thiothrix lacustris TaxID=525917 RepID=A0A1Y1QX98_9GAMM|nr:MAG: PAS domain-containing sensor histidine kinase [Thiothrix lacustris]
MADSLISRWWRWLPLLLVFVLLLVSLVLLNLATLSPANLQRYGDWHFYFSVLTLALLSGVIVANLIKVFNQWRTRQAGSRFTLRLMTGFLILTLLPVFFVSLFAVNLIGTRIDRWFSVSVERALDDSLELSDLALKTRHRQYIAMLERFKPNLRGKNLSEIPLLLEQFLSIGANEILLMDNTQQLLALALEDTETLIPQIPSASLFSMMQIRNYYSTLEPGGDGELFSRVAVTVRYGKDSEHQAILTARFPIADRERDLAESVLLARNEYKSLVYQRGVLKNMFRLMIVVIMVLTTLFSLWAAFVFSRRLTSPVRTLVEGTLAVAAGDLDKKLPVSERDDFSILARSFNTMTKRLSDARVEREHARRQLQQEHDYLHVVLEHLSSGVITLDETGTIRRVNSAANSILQQPLLDHVGKTLNELGEKLPALQPFIDRVQTHWQDMLTGREWQAEITLNTDNGRVILVCRGAYLPQGLAGQQGSVLVFDDVTDLIQSEHDAAWGEVARRLAHEIKNPLTPIQLSAERLHRKLAGELSADSASFLQRMTNTIVQQVDNLKSMVNAFSDYARAPSLRPQAVNLNALVQEVAELYRLNEGQVQIQLQLEPNLPTLSLDIHRIRQLLVNLTKNALEALEENQISPACVTISTQYPVDNHYAVLSVRDNGFGIAPELLPRLFEPYVTSKHKGTGLGLAIVKKIVEEHGGHLSARNHEGGGAILSVKFPVNQA